MAETGKTYKNDPFYLAAPEAVCYSPRPTPDRTHPNPTEIVPRVPISPYGLPRGMNRPPRWPNLKTGKNGPDLTHFSAFKLPGSYHPILMPPPGWSRRKKRNRNRRPRS